ncbi:MAG: xanthine dehydrogenase family protein molybdopterin-binding subunit [Methylobacillus sp.]|nr:xanthine dehydrogenase family protein molybdopterin-binding subunit [Methylobacillus sp.]
MSAIIENKSGEHDSGRRNFLKGSAALVGGLIISFYLPVKGGRALAAEGAAPQVYPPNAFIRISPDGVVTVIVNKSEMGQGVYTSLPMLIAEELEADWNTIRVESAPVGAIYNHTGFGMQITGGSSSIPSSWEQLRRVGATARVMLVQAAAQQWGVPVSECRAENGVVKHSGGKSLGYGELAAAAAQLPMPENVPLKDAKDFKIIGTSVKRIDTPEKINGSALFGLDVYLPNMLTVLIARSPVFGGKVKSFDAKDAMQVKGVEGVYLVPTGVAVAASGFWPAKTARDLLRIEWDEGPDAALSTAKMRADYLDLAKTPGLVARKEGDPAAALAKNANSMVVAEYEVPYLAHATMEPLNVVVDLKADACTIWCGTQSQTMDHAAAVKITGLKPEQVKIHTTYLGGGFGRRGNPRSDFMTDAVQAAKVIGKPIKVVWTREDDTQGGNYRPMWVDRIAVAVGKDGKPAAWQHTIVGQSITADTPFEAFMVKDGIDVTSVEGAATLPYAIPNLQVDLHSPKNSVPVQWWRSVGHSHTAFIVETMMDELAHMAGQDPVQYRLALLQKAPRHAGVLKLAAEKAGWGKTKLPAGHAYGVAVHESFNSYAAEIAEVSLEDGRIRVHKVVCAVDCGMVVNPDGVRQQVESAVVYGLSAALQGQITLERGRAQQSNFLDYPPLRLSRMPQVEVYTVPSNEAPTGIGEPGTPPIAPAVANAVFALTGKRLRKMPFDLEKLA